MRLSPPGLLPLWAFLAVYLPSIGLFAQLLSLDEVFQFVSVTVLTLILGGRIGWMWRDSHAPRPPTRHLQESHDHDPIRH